MKIIALPFPFPIHRGALVKQYATDDLQLRSGQLDKPFRGVLAGLEEPIDIVLEPLGDLSKRRVPDADDRR